MYRNLTLFALVVLSLAACKPTPRTALKGRHRAPQQAQQTAPAADAPAPAPQEAVVAAPAIDGSASLLVVDTTQQDFNRLRPWEKENPGGSILRGIYLGEGRVLTCGNAVSAATYVEIGLPDGSRTVPARVLRYDRDLDLALLTVTHGKDADIFATRTALEPGEPMKLGDEAEFHGLVRGLIPVHIPLLAESGEVDGGSLPRLNMRAAQPIPQGGAQGLPIVRDGKLAGMAAGYNAQTQSLSCINADRIARFLAGSDGESAGCPVLGLVFTQLDDPVFRAYLKLSDDQGGLYVQEVSAGSAAEEAGVRQGDVLTAIEGMEIDSQGRCKHPLYGLIDARAIVRSLKPQGETLALTISRDGQKQDIAVALNRAAEEKALFGSDIPGVQPRYIMWGGLLFQPLTNEYLAALRNRAKGSLPVQFLEAERREKEFREKGVTELVALTQIIPTPATLSYDGMGFCLVESVNGKPVHNFAEFARLLDEPTEDGLVALGLNKAPYTIYVDRQVAETCNAAIRRSAIPQLRQLGQPAEAQPQE